MFTKQQLRHPEFSLECLSDKHMELIEHQDDNVFAQSTVFHKKIIAVIRSLFRDLLPMYKQKFRNDDKNGKTILEEMSFEFVKKMNKVKQN